MARRVNTVSSNSLREDIECLERYEKAARELREAREAAQKVIDRWDRWPRFIPFTAPAQRYSRFLPIETLIQTLARLKAALSREPG